MLTQRAETMDTVTTADTDTCQSRVATMLTTFDRRLMRVWETPGLAARVRTDDSSGLEHLQKKMSQQPDII